MRSACFLSVARWSIPLLLAFLASCASEKDAADKQFSKLKDEVTRLQSETDRMGERLDAMEARQASAPRHSEERLAASGAPAGTFSRPKLKIVHMEPGSELGGSDEADEQASAEADTGPRLLIQGEGKSLETRTMPAAPASAKTMPPASKAPKADKAESTKTPKSGAASAQ